MWRHLGVPNDSWQNVIISWSLVKVDFVYIAEGWDGRYMGLEPNTGISAEFMLRFWAAFTAEAEGVNVNTAQLTCKHSGCLYFLISCLSLPPPPKHTASPPSFSKSPLKALLKARSGSEVTLECKPQASPPAISLWKKGNEILQRTER